MLACESLSFLPPWIKQWERKVLDQEPQKQLSGITVHKSTLPDSSLCLWKQDFISFLLNRSTYLQRHFSISLPCRQDHTEKISWLGQKGKLHFLMKFVLESTDRKTHTTDWLCQLGIGSFLFFFKWSLRKYQHMFPKCCISEGNRSFMRRALRVNVSITGKHFNTLFTWEVIRCSLFLQVCMFSCCVLLLPLCTWLFSGGTGL